MRSLMAVASSFLTTTVICGALFNTSGSIDAEEDSCCCESSVREQTSRVWSTASSSRARRSLYVYVYVGINLDVLR